MNNKNVVLTVVLATLFNAVLAKRYPIDTAVDEAFDLSAMNKRGFYNYDENEYQHSMELQRDHHNNIINAKKKRTDWLDFAAADALLAAQGVQQRQKYQKTIAHMPALKQDTELNFELADGDDADAVADVDMDADANVSDKGDADEDAGNAAEDYAKAKQTSKQKASAKYKLKKQLLRRHRGHGESKEELKERDFGIGHNGEDDDQPL